MLLPSNPNSLVWPHTDTPFSPNLTKGYGWKNSSWIILKINIISTQCVSLYTHLQNGEQQMKRRKEIKTSSAQSSMSQVCSEQLADKELQKKASEPATAPAEAELEPPVLAVAVAVPQEQYSDGVSVVAAAPGVVQDLEIPSFSLGKVQDSWWRPGVWSYNLQEGEKPAVTFIPFQRPTDLPKTVAEEQHSQQMLLKSRKEAAFSDLKFLTFVLWTWKCKLDLDEAIPHRPGNNNGYESYHHLPGNSWGSWRLLQSTCTVPGILKKCHNYSKDNQVGNCKSNLF